MPPPPPRWAGARWTRSRTSSGTTTRSSSPPPSSAQYLQSNNQAICNIARLLHQLQIQPSDSSSKRYGMCPGLIARFYNHLGNDSILSNYLLIRLPSFKSWHCTYTRQDGLSGSYLHGGSPSVPPAAISEVTLFSRIGS